MLLLKALIGVAIFIATTVAAVGQEEATNETPEPTLADVQHLAEIISSDKSKLRAYCELEKLHDETRQALEYNDTNAIAAVIAKTNAFERQLGPESMTKYLMDWIRSILVLMTGSRSLLHCKRCTRSAKNKPEE